MTRSDAQSARREATRMRFGLDDKRANGRRLLLRRPEASAWRGAGRGQPSPRGSGVNEPSARWIPPERISMQRLLERVLAGTSLTAILSHP